MGYDAVLLGEWFMIVMPPSLVKQSILECLIFEDEGKVVLQNVISHSPGSVRSRLGWLKHDFTLSCYNVALLRIYSYSGKTLLCC